MRLRKDPRGEPKRAELDRQSLPISSEMISVMQQELRDEEQRLLDIRESATHRLFGLTVVVFSVALILALLLFSIQYWFLSAELKAREQAEQMARHSEDSLRQLTGRLLQLQDAEREISPASSTIVWDSTWLA